MFFGQNEAKIFCPVHTDHWQTPQFRKTINVLTALTMLSFFDVMLIILLRRSLFAAEFIRAFFQSNRWFKIFTKYRVVPVRRNYKLHHTGPKALADVQPSSGGCEPLKGPGDLHSNHPSCSPAAAWTKAFVPQLGSSSDAQECFTVLSFIPLRALLSTLDLHFLEKVVAL